MDQRSSINKFSLIILAVLALIIIPISVYAISRQTNTQSKADTTPTPLPSFIPTPSLYPPSIPAIQFGVSYKHSPFTAEFIAKDKDINEILQVTASGLPDGLTITKCTDQSTNTSSSLSCLISGQPTVTGTFVVTLIATDKMGNTGKTTSQLTVGDWYERFSLLPSR